MKPRSFKKNRLGDFKRVMLIIAAILLSVYLVVIVISSQEYFVESAEKNAMLSFENDINLVSSLADVHYNNLYDVVDQIQYAGSAEEVETIISSYIGCDQFGDLRYYSQGKSYSANGVIVEFEHSADAEIRKLSQSKTAGCTGVYYDKITKFDCMAFFVPVRGSAYVDGILSIVPARNIVELDGSLQDKSTLMVIIDESGRVYADTMAESFGITIGNNFYNFLDRLTSNKDDANELAELILRNEKGVLTVSFGSEEYTLAYSPIERLDNHYYLVTMNGSEVLIAPEYEYVRQVIALLIIAIVALVIGFVFAMLYKKQSKKELASAILVDSQLDCPNLEQFRRNVQERVAIGGSKYTIVVFLIKNLLYIGERLNESEMTEVLRFVAKLFDNFTGVNEGYAYLGDGKFAIMMHNNTQHAVKDKIHMLKTVSNRNDVLSSRGLKLRYNVGVYHIGENRRRTAQQMIECAMLAAEHMNDNVNKSYNVYSEVISEDIVRNEHIEVSMETALKNRDFKVFVQPKYNVANDRIDSVEALVRWFDPKKGDYMFPVEFIPLFETNGFIVKLDHFVYTEVLEFISQAVERGENVVPVSINVSRVTACQEDFFNFYIENKNKYRIPDGFITLEITESFAMEDYDKIVNIIERLHKNGIKCSIDDFGSGYSSFNILKHMPVDELKLDAIFTRRGTNAQNDDKILRAMIDLAKSMGMIVVQEGVETEEFFNKIVAMGVDVVQGYYYAKAISLEEFRIFVNSNTSIKYKSKVK